MLATRQRDGKRNAPRAATLEASNDRTGEDQISPRVPTASTRRKSAQTISALTLALLLETMRAHPVDAPRFSLAHLERLADLDGLDGQLADAARDVPGAVVAEALVDALAGITLPPGADEVARLFVEETAAAVFVEALELGPDAALERLGDGPDAGGPLSTWLGDVVELARSEDSPRRMPPHLAAGASLDVLADGLLRTGPEERLDVAELAAYVLRVERALANYRAGFTPDRGAR